MLSLPSQKKWQIYCSRKGGDDTVDQAHAPEHYIERLQTLATVGSNNAKKNVNKIKNYFWFQSQYPEINTEEEVRTRTKQIDGLKTALRTSTHSFVIKFIELDGLSALLQCLEQMDYFTAQSSIHTSIIGCFKALMNNSVGETTFFITFFAKDRFQFTFYLLKIILPHHCRQFVTFQTIK